MVVLTRGCGPYAEKSFAILSEFVRDFILGLMAGLITTGEVESMHD